jgi:gliding motility-associated-like protein
MSKYIIVFFALMLGQIGFTQITTDNTTFTVDQLIDGVLFEGGCTPITNIQSRTGVGANGNGIAYFQANGSSFPLSDGIILSTGNALNANGPNSLGDRSDNLFSGNDNDLESVMAAAGSPLISLDATWVSFDFVPTASFISFDYLFASEEYNGNFECQFADAFAFILTDSVTGAVTNLATIPGSNLPVQVITVRDPPPNACAPVNPTFFDQYNLGNNTFGEANLGSPAVTSPIEFNGQTTVLTATSAVVPNRSYNIKLVIADASDTEYDSAVFIEGGSFDISVDLGGSRIISRGNPLCYGDVYTLDASLSLLPGTTVTYAWSQSGTIIPGETGAILNVTEDGFYEVEITFSIGCTANSSVRLEFVDLPDASPPDAISCDPSGVGSFDLTIIESVLLNALNAPDYTVTFYESQMDAQNNTNALPTTFNYQGLSNPQTLFVRVEDNLFGCEVIYPFQLIVDDVFAAPVQDIVGCDDDTDGITTVTLADFDPLVGPGYTPGTVTISYYITQADADADINPLGATFTNTISPETIYARVVATNDTGCFDTTSINIVVNVEPEAAQSTSDLLLCEDETLNGGTATFDLTVVENDIIGAQNFTDVTISYYISQSNADNAVTAILNPAAFVNTANPQTIFVRLEDNNSSCFNTATAFDIIVNEVPVITIPLVYDLCDDSTIDGFTEFDLTSRNNEITGGTPGVTLFYYATASDAFNRMNELSSPYTNIANPQTVFVIVEDNMSGCVSSTTLDLEVKEAPQAIAPPSIIVCDNSNTGDLTEVFNLTVNEAAILNGQTIGIIVTYHSTQADADNDSNEIAQPTSFDNTTTPQTIYVRAENSTGCFNTTSFDIIVNEIAIPQLFDLYYLCRNSDGSVLNTADSPPILDTGLNPNALSFTWELDGSIINGESSAALTATLVGMYTVTVTDQATGCNSLQTTEVRELGPPDDFGAQVTTRFFNERQRIEAFATGPASQYIFRLEDGPWQYNGSFNDVSPGPHIVVIQDLEGCASVEVLLNVVGYPLYFTPNNDGYHDTWNIIGLNEIPNATIYIFDRYGKLLKQVDPTGIGWDGTYKGQPLASSDYWFQVDYEENGTPKSFGGHFTLKR